MDVQPDFKDLLALFNARKVEYLIVGGYALAFHGSPRLTGDMDLLVRSSRENAARFLTALKEFGFGSLGLSEDDFFKEGKVVQLGVPPVRVDILTSMTGVPWEEAAAGAVAGSYGEVPVKFIGRAALAKNKKAVGRLQDLADIEALGEK